jgi:hypothetical protein
LPGGTQSFSKNHGEGLHIFTAHHVSRILPSHEMATDFATPKHVPVQRLSLPSPRLEDLECRKTPIQNFALIAIECENVRSMYFNLVYLTLNSPTTAAVRGRAPDRKKLLSEVPNALAIPKLRDAVEIESQAI